MHSHTEINHLPITGLTREKVSEIFARLLGEYAPELSTSPIILELCCDFFALAQETYYTPLNLQELDVAIRQEGNRLMLAFIDDSELFSLLNSQAERAEETFQALLAPYPLAELHYRREEEKNVLALMIHLQDFP